MRKQRPITPWYGGEKGAKCVGLCIALIVNRNGCNMWRLLDFCWVGVGKIGDR